ncbi:MAG: HAD hydrolase-like protein [Rhizobiaceae bacterium]|nr:HAD hydrolase-like protein [Rhizobiaceae bacterium]
MPKPIIVFDLDGTLIDTAPDLLDSLNHSLGLAGLSPVEAAPFRAELGMGSRAMLQRAFASVRRDFIEGELDSLQTSFLDHYRLNIPGRSRPYPGVLAALDRFEAAGFELAICTNKIEKSASALIEGLGLAPRFAAIAGADTFPFRKPDPRHLTETIAMAKADASRAVMIGDSRTDIDTAKAAGIPVIAVDFGYTDRHVREFDPSMVVSTYDEITLEAVERLIAAAG